MNSPESLRRPPFPRNLLFTRIFPGIGGVGLLLTIALNVAALVILKRTTAEFFSTKWWSIWFPSYLVWTSFCVMGASGLLMKRD